MRSSISVSATSRLPLRKGTWIGGELVDFRAEGDTIPMLIYRINFANPAADRYLAPRAVAGTQDEGGARRGVPGRSPIGEFNDMRVIQRGSPSVSSAPRSSARPDAAPFRALRLRTLLGLRDSLFSYDIERNAAGAVVGETSSAAAGGTASACARSAPTAWRWRARPTTRS